MFADWVTHGVQVGVEICSATFTVIVIVGAIVGIVGICAKIWQETENESTKKNRIRPN